MPRNKQQPRGAMLDKDSVVLVFHTILDVTSTTNASQVNVSPNATISPRALVEADAWAHYRVRRFAFRILPFREFPVASDPGGVEVAVGYVGGVQDSPPNTSANIMELLPSQFMSYHQTVPNAWTNVPAKDLAGPFPWYKTIPGTADATEEAPGQLCISLTAATSATYHVELMGEFQFKTSVSSGNTPLAAEYQAWLRAERRRKVDEAERAKLLSVMATPTASVPAPRPPK